MSGCDNRNEVHPLVQKLDLENTRLCSKNNVEFEGAGCREFS